MSSICPAAPLIEKGDDDSGMRKLRSEEGSNDDSGYLTMRLVLDEADENLDRINELLRTGNLRTLAGKLRTIAGILGTAKADGELRAAEADGELRAAKAEGELWAAGAAGGAAEGEGPVAEAEAEAEGGPNEDQVPVVTAECNPEPRVVEDEEAFSGDPDHLPREPEDAEDAFSGGHSAPPGNDLELVEEARGPLDDAPAHALGAYAGYDQEVEDGTADTHVGGAAKGEEPVTEAEAEAEGGPDEGQVTVVTAECNPEPRVVEDEEASSGDPDHLPREPEDAEDAVSGGHCAPPGNDLELVEEARGPLDGAPAHALGVHAGYDQEVENGSADTRVPIICRRMAGLRKTKLTIPSLSSTSWKRDKLMDPEYVRRNYSWGIRNGTLLCMIMGLVLMNLFTPMLTLPGLPIDDPIAVVWRISLLVSTKLFFLVFLMRTTAGILDILPGISYLPLLAFAASNLISPLSGMTIVHLSTAWAAGMFGYSLAQYCQHEGTESAASVAVALTPKGLSKKGRRQRLYTRVHCVFSASLVTLCLAGRVLWLVLVPTYDDIYFLVLELSVLISTILYFWLLIVSTLMLHGALISLHSMVRIYAYYMVSFAAGLVCALMSQVLCAYFFGLGMMIMAGVLGYSLAIHARYKELLPQEGDVHPRRKTMMTTRPVLDSVPPEDADIAEKADVAKEVDAAPAAGSTDTAADVEHASADVATEIDTAVVGAAMNASSAEIVTDYNVGCTQGINVAAKTREPIRSEDSFKHPGSVKDTGIALEVDAAAGNAENVSTVREGEIAAFMEDASADTAKEINSATAVDVANDKNAAAMGEVDTDDTVTAAVPGRADAESVHHKKKAATRTRHTENSVAVGEAEIATIEDVKTDSADMGVSATLAANAASVEDVMAEFTMVDATASAGNTERAAAVEHASTDIAKEIDSAVVGAAMNASRVENVADTVVCLLGDNLTAKTRQSIGSEDSLTHVESFKDFGTAAVVEDALQCVSGWGHPHGLGEPEPAAMGGVIQDIIEDKNVAVMGEFQGSEDVTSVIPGRADAENVLDKKMVAVGEAKNATTEDFTADISMVVDVAAGVAENAASVADIAKEADPAGDAENAGPGKDVNAVPGIADTPCTVWEVDAVAVESANADDAKEMDSAVGAADSETVAVPGRRAKEDVILGMEARLKLTSPSRQIKRKEQSVVEKNFFRGKKWGCAC